MVRFLGVFSVLFLALSQAASAGSPPGGFPWPDIPEQNPPKQEQGPKQELPPKQEEPKQEQGPKQELPPLKEEPKQEQGKQEQGPGQELPPLKEEPKQEQGKQEQGPGQELPPMGQVPPSVQNPGANLCYGVFRGTYYGEQFEATFQIEPAGGAGELHVTAWQYGRVWQGMGRCWQNSPWEANMEIYFPSAPVQRGVVSSQGGWVIFQGQIDGGRPFRFYRQQ